MHLCTWTANQDEGVWAGSVHTYRVGERLVHPQHALPSTVRLINPNPLVWKSGGLLTLQR